MTSEQAPFLIRRPRGILESELAAPFLAEPYVSHQIKQENRDGIRSTLEINKNKSLLRLIENRQP